MLSQETQARLTQKHLRGVSDIVEPGRADKRVGVLAQALRRPTSHGRHSLYMALSARQRALQILPRRRLRPLHQTHHFNIGSRSAKRRSPVEADECLGGYGCTARQASDSATLPHHRSWRRRLATRAAPTRDQTCPSVGRSLQLSLLVQVSMERHLVQRVGVARAASGP